MSYRITIKNLDGQCTVLNRITNSPEMYRRGDVIQVGHYHISQSYGGFNLYRVANTSGGVDCPLGIAHIPARELSGLMFAYVAGIQYSKGE